MPNLRFNKGNTEEIISFSFKDKVILGKKAENNSKRSVHIAASQMRLGSGPCEVEPCLANTDFFSSAFRRAVLQYECSQKVTPGPQGLPSL